MMTLQRFMSPTLVFAALLTTAACSSKSESQVKRVDMEHKNWDYAQIRKAHANEAAEASAATADVGDDANCVIMTHEQMVRSKASGCRKMDPREGGGENSYCCPQ